MSGNVRAEFGSRRIVQIFWRELRIERVDNPPRHYVYHSGYLGLPLHLNENIPKNAVWLRNRYGRVTRKITIPHHMLDFKTIKIDNKSNDIEWEKIIEMINEAY